MEMHALQTGRKPRVVTAMTMLKQMLFRYAFNGSFMRPFLTCIYPDIKGMLERHWSWAALIPQVLTSLQSTLMALRTSFRMLLWVLEVWLRWLFLKAAGSRIWG